MYTKPASRISQVPTSMGAPYKLIGVQYTAHHSFIITFTTGTFLCSVL